MAVVTNQTHFRVRTDSTAAQGGTPVWAAALDTNPPQGFVPPGTPFRIRFAISDTGSTATGTHPWNIFVSRNGGAFAQVTTSTSFVITTDATAGASAENSAITTSLLGGTGTFDGIGVYDDTGTTGNVSIPGGDFSEFEFGLQFTTGVIAGDTYAFEVFLNGVALSSYTATPTITIPPLATSLTPKLGSLPAWFPQPDPASYYFIQWHPTITPTLQLVQQDFRVRTDATAAQGGTPVWRANENLTTPDASNGLLGSEPIGTAFRIRFSVYNHGGTSTNNSFQLYASHNSGPYTAVTTSSAYVVAADATAGASSNNSAITTNLLVEGTGTFSGVGVYNDTGSTSSISLPSGDRCEFEFGIKLTTSCSIGDQVTFQVFYNNSSFGSYTNIPTIVAGGSVSPSATNLLATINFNTCLRNNFTGNVGLEFTTPASPPVIVTSLGMWVNAGNTSTATIEIVDSATGNAVIVSASLNTNGLSPGFNYVSIPPTTLTASHTYFLARSITSGGDYWWDVDEGSAGNKLPVTAHLSVTINGSEYESGTTWTTNNSGLFSYAGVDFITGNPPFSSRDNASGVLAAWIPPTPQPILSQLIAAVIPVVVSQVPYRQDSVLSAVLSAWIPPPPSPIVATPLNPALSAVPVNNPPFNSRDNLNGILSAWIPPPPQAPVAGLLNPAFEAVPVNNPPFNSRDNASGILAAWIPPPPQAPLPGLLNPALEAVPVNNPPFAHPGRSAIIEQQALAAAAWQSDPVYYQFIGGNAPYLPRYLPASITAVPVNNPIPALQGQAPWWTWWLPADPTPQLQPRLAQGPPAPTFVPKTSDLTAIVAGWLLPALPAVMARNLPPAITAVEVDNPPFSQRNNTVGVLAAWIPPPPDPIVAGRVNPALEAVPVSNPPFGIPQPSLTGILAAWIPPPPQPIVAGTVNAVFEAVPVNNPPFGVPSPSLGVIRAAWEPPPPAPIVAGLVGPALETAPVINNPPFSHPGRNEAVSRSVASWQSDPVYWQFFGGSGSYLPRYLPASITAVPVNNPPIKLVSASVLSSILTGWIPPAPQPIVAGLLGPALEAIQVNNPPFAGLTANLVSVLAAWIPPPPQPITAGSVNAAIEAVPVNNPPFNSRDNATGILLAWIPPPPAPIVATPLNPALSAVPVNNPPFGAKPFAGLWEAAQSLPVVGRLLAPPLLILHQQPPPLGQADVSRAWIPPDPAVQLQRYVPQAFAPPVVNNPPPGGRNIGPQLIWWGRIEQLQLKPFYAMTAQPSLFIDPQYLLSGPVNARGLSGPLPSLVRSVEGPELRTDTGPTSRSGQGPTTRTASE